jgi:hypothetical protein
MDELEVEVPKPGRVRSISLNIIFSIKRERGGYMRDLMNECVGVLRTRRAVVVRLPETGLDDGEEDEDEDEDRTKMEMRRKVKMEMEMEMKIERKIKIKIDIGTKMKGRMRKDRAMAFAME